MYHGSYADPYQIAAKDTDEGEVDIILTIPVPNIRETWISWLDGLDKVQTKIDGYLGANFIIIRDYINISMIMK